MAVRMRHPDHGEMDCLTTQEVSANEGRGWVRVTALVAPVVVAAPEPVPVEPVAPVVAKEPEPAPKLPKKIPQASSGVL